MNTLYSSVRFADMSHPARTTFLYGIYLIAVGVAYTLAPNQLLPLIDLKQTPEPWIQMFSIVVAFVGCYYIQASRYEFIPFIRMTVYIRYSVILTFAVVMYVDDVRWELLLFGLPDVLGATWTAVALREKQQKKPRGEGRSFSPDVIRRSAR